MRRKAIEKIAPPKNRHKKMEFSTKLQWLDQIAIFNVYYGSTLRYRHCFDTVKKEYATYCYGAFGNEWRIEKIEKAYNIQIDSYYGYYGGWKQSDYEKVKLSREDEETLIQMIPEEYFEDWRSEKTIINTVSRLEREYGQERREITENNRCDRVRATMDKVPPIPAGILGWIDEKHTGAADYCLKNRESGMWSCSSCGESFDESFRKGAKNDDMVECPRCKKKIKLQTRKKRVEEVTHFILIQPIDDEISVARHFSADICCLPGQKKSICIVEDVRIILFKNRPESKKTKTCSLYYEQYTRPFAIVDDTQPIFYGGCFDNKSNPANKREYHGYLYNGGIEEAFKDTVYEPWTRLFTEMSAAGLRLNYNAMMCGLDERYINLIEMLYRGRFKRLLQEESGMISYWSYGYNGQLDLDGSSIEEVFKIQDRQKINRIRDKNEGNLMIEWMRWSDRHRQKISDKALEWLLSNSLAPNEMSWIKCRFTIEQAMNYITRQQNESYKTKTTRGVISQYEDYMKMCERLGKDTSDEMVYRPKELKRRHDEAVHDIEFREAEVQAEEYSRKYKEAENVLQSIKGKFEYSGEKYFIIVPSKIVDIVTEGRCLHHCAGATDRYFDRIKQNETYICFLRKQSDPKTPYYTIEVEPGGTIRQHRGYMDEEPEIEEVKPFLKEWQKEIRKRMNENDHKLAAESKVKREANIEDLKQKNNTRVLKGLMEDFMEAAI